MSDLTLFIKNSETDDYTQLDLNDIWEHGDVLGEDSMHAALVNEVALYAIDQGASFGDIVGYTIDDEDGQELSINSSQGNSGWIREVVQLYMHLNVNARHNCPDEAVLAYIDNVGWSQFKFDIHFDVVEDKYVSEFDGDYEDYAKERMSEQNEDLPDHLESYFNYSEYGESLVDEYDRVSWGYTEFLFGH